MAPVVSGPPPLRPTRWFHDIYPQDHVYSPRSSPRMSRWLPSDRDVMDNATGAQIPVAGELPVVCARGVATPSGLALTREAGVAEPGPLLAYTTEEERLACLRNLAEEGRRLIVQYLHPPDDVPPEAYWVERELLSFLNDKANLEALVPEGRAPSRGLVQTEGLPGLTGDPLPFVLKATTDESSGGGLDVLVCREPEDVARAPDFFAATERVVVETYLEIRSNLCLAWVVLPDGCPEYVGAAEQMSREDGRFEGNWLIRDLEVPEAAVEASRRTVDRAARRGYRGCVGIDVAVLDSGEVLIFDLNFRVNNSTTILLLQSSLMAHHPFGAARLVGWRCPDGFDVMLRRASRAMERGDLLPLGTFDPRVGGHEGPARVRTVVLGACREDVLGRMERLAEDGLTR